MPDIELLGQHTGIDRSRLPLFVGIGALAIGLLLFRRPAAPPAAGGGRPADYLEFARVSSGAATDMAALSAATNLRRHELDLAYANTPAGMRQCYPVSDWNALPREVRRSIVNQGKRGGNVIAASGGQVCVTPSDRGISGDLQTVQRSKAGLFSSSSSGIGAPAPPTPSIGILDALQSYFSYDLGVRGRPQIGGLGG